MVSNPRRMLSAIVIAGCVWLADCGRSEPVRHAQFDLTRGVADSRTPVPGGHFDAAQHPPGTALAQADPGAAPTGLSSSAAGTPLAAHPLTALLPGGPAVASTAPKDADVIFSPRFDRPEAPSVAKAYGATRIEWSYITNTKSIAALRAAVGGRFGGAINNNAVTDGNAGAAIDFDGKPIVAPWMASWGAVWNSCAAPAGIQALKGWVDKVLATGATSIQFDDPGMQFDSSFWSAGDLSPANLKLFRAWVEAQNAAGVPLPITPAQAGDYRNWLGATHAVTGNADYAARSRTFPSTAAWQAFLRDTVSQCLLDIRSHLKTASGNQATLSMNVYTPLPWANNAFVSAYTDFIVGEMAPDHSEFHHLLFIGQWLRMDGKRWAPVFPLADKQLLRTRIAGAYAVGGNPVIPWDMFIQGTPTAPASRYFGSPDDFADLYRFVRQNARLLNGWEPLSRLNLLVYRDPSSITMSFAQLKRLAGLQVPYVPYVRKAGELSTGARNAADTNPTLRLVASKGASGDQQPLLERVTDAGLQPLAVATAVTPGLQVIVKANASMPGSRVVHVLRTAGTASGRASMTISAWALGSATSFDARVASPSGVEIRLGTVARRSDGSLTLSIPAPAEWSLVELSPVGGAN